MVRSRFTDRFSSCPSSWRLPGRDTIRKDFPAYRGRDLFGIIRAQLKIENVKVFDDPLFSHRFWNYNDFTLNKPAQYDLSDGLVVFFCDREQHFVFEHVVKSLSEWEYDWC